MIFQFVTDGVRVMVTLDAVNVRFDDINEHKDLKDHQKLINKLLQLCSDDTLSISTNRYYSNKLKPYVTEEMMKSFLEKTSGRGVLWAYWR